MNTTHRLAIVGDLHYETEQQPILTKAQQQIADLKPDAVVSLGDQGGYSHCGSRLSFAEGYGFFSSFGVPFYALIGNHDMEGAEFEHDHEAVAAWCQQFGYPRPYTSFDLGPALGITLSQTSFRNNPGSHHEVNIDDEQFAWFAQTLAQNPDRPTFVFSHAPILGSGVRVLQDLHLKGPNAFLNNYTHPERFLTLLQANPQLKLWFSAHIHLSHDYADTISHVGQCTFVHCGVIGDHSRDGRRHTRFLTHNPDGFSLHTLDHTNGRLRPDVDLQYQTNQLVRHQQFAEQPADRYFAPPPVAPEDALAIGNSLLVKHRGMLVEYDRTLQAPIGVVNDNLNGGHVWADGDVLVIEYSNGSQERHPPNEYGRYLHAYFANPWRQKTKA